MLKTAQCEKQDIRYQDIRHIRFDLQIQYPEMEIK